MARLRPWRLAVLLEYPERNRAVERLIVFVCTYRYAGRLCYTLQQDSVLPGAWPLFELVVGFDHDVDRNLACRELRRCGFTVSQFYSHGGRRPAEANSDGASLLATPARKLPSVLASAGAESKRERLASDHPTDPETDPRGNRRVAGDSGERSGAGGMQPDASAAGE